MPEASAPKPTRAPVTIGRSPRPEWSYWEPTEVTLRPAPRGEDLSFPLVDAQIRNLPADAAARATLREEGLVYVKTDERTFAGAYRAWAPRGPVLVTADALFFVTHLALSTAMDEIEREVLVNDLGLLLAKAYVRLSSDALSAPPDLVPAYRLARGVIGVAQTLFDPKQTMPPDLQAVVAAEVGLIQRHAGLATSPLFGFALDYGALAPGAAMSEPAAERGARVLPSTRASEALLGPHVALAWLAAAPFALVSQSEQRESAIRTGQARTATRAALLLAFCTEPANDVEMAAAYDRLRAVLRFELGPVDDLSLSELATLATKQNITLANRRSFASSVVVDKLRHLASERHDPEVYDGVFNLATSAGRPVGRSTASVRVFGSHAPVDAQIASALVFPYVGAGASKDHPRAWRQQRVLPSALDLLAWMGSSPARAQLAADGDFAFNGFEAQLARTQDAFARADSPRAHASVYDSWFDAVVTFVQVSLGEGAEPAFERPSYAIRKAELAAAAWAIGRHDAEPFAHLQGAAVSKPAAVRTSDAYVEANPETYAKLVALLQQASRGWSALGVLGPRGRAALTEAAQLVQVALDAAVAAVDAKPRPEALATLPLRLAEFEERVAPGAAVEMVTDVHADASSGRVLQAGTGPLQQLALVVQRDDEGVVIARGPALSFREHMQDTRDRLNDASWRAALRAGRVPVLAPFRRGSNVSRQLEPGQAARTTPTTEDRRSEGEANAGSLAPDW